MNKYKITATKERLAEIGIYEDISGKECVLNSERGLVFEINVSGVFDEIDGKIHDNRIYYVQKDCIAKID